MALDTTALRPRRALLTGTVSGLAALAATALGRPDRGLAATGDPVILGANNVSDIVTWILRVDGNTSVAITRSGYALDATAHSTGGIGVRGSALGGDGYGVVGTTSGHYTQVAVLGTVDTDQGEGIGVKGVAKNGIALYGEATAGGGYALQAVGRAVFSRSGKVTMTKGQSSRTIPGYPITPASLVLATIQGNVAGTWVRGVTLNDAADTFTIRLNKPAPKALIVGWFIVN